MGEDQASRRLDVDEHGLAHGDNVWSRLSSESFPSISLSRKGTSATTSAYTTAVG